ncbi:MAG: cell division protein FtsK, partial [Actinomycetales bacterium]|nr:cell division protein FtsK [Actinomycetales bacterium]
MVRGVWMGGAHLVGGTARKIGQGARDLDPAHRRDGVAFALLALAVVVAAREWWGLEGTFGDVVHAVVGGTFGRVAVAVPLLLLVGAVRLMRHPERTQENSRVSIGLTALVVAACGLVHVAEDLPAPADGIAAVRDAGGVIGYLVATPLVAAVTIPFTVALLILLAFFGILVVTKTPVHMIVPRLRAGYRRLTGQHEVEGEADEDAPLVINHGHSALPEDEAKTKRLSLRERRAKRAAEKAEAELLEQYRADEAFEQAAYVEEDHDDEVVEDVQDDVATVALGVDPATPAPLAAPPTSGVPAGTQPTLEGDYLYSLPAEDSLAKGAPHKVRSAANDRVVEALTTVL